jgi:hypothetical protein
MGIFGFLSKAHLDQAVPTGDVAAKVALIDEKIKTEKETIDAARKTIIQLDSQVDQTITRTSNDSTDKGIGRSIAIRKSQAGERKSIYSTIEEAQKKISKLNEERAPIATELRKVEAEVGPIKYIAALIYGDNPQTDVLEKAVRWVIILIVSVFDPLAVLMLVAANWSLKHRKKEEPKGESPWADWDDKAKATEDFNPRPEPQEIVEWPEDEDRMDIIGMNGNEGLHYDEIDLEEIKNLSGVDQNMKMTESLFDTEEEFFAHGKVIAQELDANEGLVPKEKYELDPTFMKLLDDNDIIPTPKPPHQELTIEKEVEKLQKTIEYDSAGRRITP